MEVVVMKRLVVAIMVGVMALSYTGCGEGKIKEAKEESVARNDRLVQCEAYVADRSVFKYTSLLFSVTLKSDDCNCAFVLVDLKGDLYFKTLEYTEDDLIKVTALIDENTGSIDHLELGDEVYIDYRNLNGVLVTDGNSLSIYTSKYYDLSTIDGTFE